MLRHIKIGEPNVNCAYIPLNPTYYISKGGEVDTPYIFYKTYTNDLLGFVLLKPYLCHCQLIVGWVEHPDIFCWVSFLYPTYVPTIFLLSAKPNIKMTTYN